MKYAKKYDILKPKSNKNAKQHRGHGFAQKGRLWKVKRRTYENAEIRIILLEFSDIVTTSGGGASGDENGVIDDNWDVND